MEFGLRWVRRRQRALSRGVLALFCLAWLQAAVVPCVMAHGQDTVTSPQAAAHAHDDAGAMSGHDAMMSGASDHSAHPCPYCPPAGAADCGDGQVECAYPHGPQVDVRAAGALFVAVPATPVAPSPGVLLIEDRAIPAVPAIPPRVSISVSYCRFLE